MQRTLPDNHDSKSLRFSLKYQRNNFTFAVSILNVVLKRFFLFIFLTASTAIYSQDFSTLWQAHYSYNAIVDVADGNTKIYAAAENAVFSYDILSAELNTITTIEGLSGEQITTIHYSEDYQYVIIGYETGLIEIYFENDNSVLSIVDILDKQNIPPNNKRINDFYETNGFIYISTDFGISVYDLEGLEFGDTYFIGNGGAQISVQQVSILNNQIYAACSDQNGVKRADLSNPNLIDFQQWQTLINGNYVSMNTLNDKIYTVRTNRVLYEIQDTNFIPLLTFDTQILDAKVGNANLIYTELEKVSIYDQNIQLVDNFVPTEDYDTTFTSAIQVDETIYIGTDTFGVLSASVPFDNMYTEIKPNGPLENSVFRLNATTNTVWATYGEYTEALNPFPLTSKGISYLNNEEWRNFPFDSLLGTRELNEISPNIFNPNQIFISSYKDGLLEINNFEPTIQLNQTNSGLESLILPNNPNFVGIRVSASEFDTNGLLWTMTSRVDRALKSYDPLTGNWQGFSFSDLIDDPTFGENGFFDMEIGPDGTKWIGSYNNGLIAYNENIATDPLRSMNSESQNIPPFTRFTALALDNRNQLWIGTTNGLRILLNTTGFYDNPNPTLNQIIILEDGIPKELLDDQSITDIKVDGSNNKWIGTVDSGVFYFTSDGQTTIYHFTTESSPLPSNTINDIAIDEDNGIVYIATNKGLLSFTAGGSEIQDSLENVYAYPNPVRPEYNILGFDDLRDITKGVKISGLTDNVNIKITDIEGNLVAEAQSRITLRSSNINYNFAIDGGTAIWNGKNLSNNVVATGVYLIMISDLSSFETKVLKVLVVR